MQHKILIRHRSDFANDPLFYQTLYAISQSAYEQPEAIIRYSIERNDTVYCLLNSNGEMAGVLFTNWQDQQLIIPDGQLFTCIYIGWGVVRPASQGKGVFQQLLEFFKTEIVSYFQLTKKPLFLYARTASPPVYRRLKRVFTNLQPETNG